MVLVYSYAVLYSILGIEMSECECGVWSSGSDMVGRSGDVPIALSEPALLDGLGVVVDITRFGKVAREVLFGCCGAVGEADMVTVVLLLGAGH